ncbi:hypothetical protein [Candidatus Tisiphia endosymbiont of Myopa tessellatipennis]|uniref:hypothetical protein n=1 Tax=Candidatus Tisiphia endosymbiont of Myopa tessellatipennis TaxID=3066257 RepID=UPI00313D26CF
MSRDDGFLTFNSCGVEGNLKAKEAIYFMDSVHPQYQTKARYGWIRILLGEVYSINLKSW